MTPRFKALLDAFDEGCAAELAKEVPTLEERQGLAMSLAMRVASVILGNLCQDVETLKMIAQETCEEIAELGLQMKNELEPEETRQ